jgi:hypothetical protein
LTEQLGRHDISVLLLQEEGVVLKLEKQAEGSSLWFEGSEFVAGHRNGADLPAGPPEAKCRSCVWESARETSSEVNL